MSILFVNKVVKNINADKLHKAVLCAMQRKTSNFPRKLHWWTCHVKVLYNSDHVGFNVGKPHSRTSQLDSIKRHLTITKDAIEAFFYV